MNYISPRGYNELDMTEFLSLSLSIKLDVCNFRATQKIQLIHLRKQMWEDAKSGLT